MRVSRKCGCEFVGIAALILFAAGACAQNWPSDAQVFRDVYGQVDANGSVRWDAAKESKPSPWATGQEMEVEILLRAEVGGKLYVATSAVPKVAERDKCHACRAALGGVVYERANGAWKLEATSEAATYAGGWGGPPAGMELRRCGERTYCFVVEDGFTAQGYTDVSLRVYGPVGSSVRELLTVPVESDEPGGARTMSASVRFVASNVSRTGFFDVEVLRVKCAGGRCSSAAEQQLYRYRDGEYMEARPGRVAGGQLKRK